MRCDLIGSRLPRLALLLCLILALAGCRTVTVLDEQGTPVPGASVTLYRFSISGVEIGPTNKHGQASFHLFSSPAECLVAELDGKSGKVFGRERPLVITLSESSVLTPAVRTKALQEGEPFHLDRPKRQ